MLYLIVFLDIQTIVSHVVFFELKFKNNEINWPVKKRLQLKKPKKNASINTYHFAK